MSKLISFEQSKKIQALGISIVSDCGYVGYTKSGELVSRRKFKEDKEYQTIPCWIRVFTLSEAIDWIREEKRIACAVGLNVNSDNRFLGNYIYEYIIENNRVEGCSGFDTHLLAESALLDAVLTYLEKK